MVCIFIRNGRTVTLDGGDDNDEQWSSMMVVVFVSVVECGSRRRIDGIVGGGTDGRRHVFVGR